MKRIYFAVILVFFSVTAWLIFPSCKQEQCDDFTVTLRKMEKEKPVTQKHTYWYKASGTITMISKTSEENNYEININDGNLYVSWTEDPNRKSNYADYSLNFIFDYFEKDSSVKRAKQIEKTVCGVNGKYDLAGASDAVTFSINGDITGDSFYCTINYPSFFISSKNLEMFNAEIKLTCKKV